MNKLLLPLLLAPSSCYLRAPHLPALGRSHRRLLVSSPRWPAMNENESLDDANRLYPEKRWAWQRADYKTSLKEELHQENPAPSWLINIVELAHWVSFPIGFYIAFYLFTNAAVIAQAGHWSGSVTGVFFIMLGILNQVFGGGMAVLMHVYEGWMVAPFKNLLVLPSNPTTEQIDAIRTQNYNNAWLRAAAYQMLMTFQSLGLSLFSLGVFGIKPWTALLVSATVLISLLGPKEPRLDLNRKVDGVSRPVLPLSLSLTIVLAVNVLVQLVSCLKIFYPVFRADGFNEVFALVMAILPSSLQGAGGAIEGYFAESTFKQWQHLVAFLILLSGFLLLGNAFSRIVGLPPAVIEAFPFPTWLKWIGYL